MSEKLNEKLGTIGIVWKLNDMYKGHNDIDMDKDLEHCRSEAEALNTLFAEKVKTLSDHELLSLVKRLENLSTRMGKLATFAFLNFSTQTNNAEASALLQKIREISSAVGKQTVFFDVEWSKLDNKAASKLLQSSVLEKYQHYLDNLRRYAKHLLSQTEETLLLEKAPVGRSSWTNLFDKVMGHMKFGKNQRTEEEVLADLYNPDREIRKKAASELTQGLSGHLHILTHIFNTILADKMIDDRLRNYPSWLRSMNLYNELQDQTVAILVEAVTERYDIPQRYYKLKRGLIGLDTILDYDRYAPLPHLSGNTAETRGASNKDDENHDSHITWEECKKIVLNAFAGFSPEMAEIAGLFFDRNWIHAPVQPGKRGGAFAHPCVPEVHPYIMVNYTGNIRDVSTVAHELGHGIHQYLAAEQGYYNSDTPLVLAETASVFGELLVFTHQLATLTNPDQRKAYICQKLESIFATVFRQVAMNRFEDLVHTMRRDKGELSSDDFSRQWILTQKAMLGDSVTLTEDYGVWWSYIPHFLSTPGYVYSYAFGELLVLSLYNLYQKEKEPFVPKYLELLKSGGSRTPYQLLEPFGINLDSPQFWQGGLKIIDDMLLLVES